MHTVIACMNDNLEDCDGAKYLNDSARITENKQAFFHNASTHAKLLLKQDLFNLPCMVALVENSM